MEVTIVEDETTVQAVRLWRSTDYLLNTGVWGQIAFDTEVFDTNDLHSNSTNTSQIVIKEAGYYHIEGGLWLDQLADQKYGVVYIYKNGTTRLAGTQVYSSSSANSDLLASISTIAYLNQGDYIELWVVHNHGSYRNIKAYSPYTPYLALKELK